MHVINTHPLTSIRERRVAANATHAIVLALAMSTQVDAPRHEVNVHQEVNNTALHVACKIAEKFACLSLSQVSDIISDVNITVGVGNVPAILCT